MLYFNYFKNKEKYFNLTKINLVNSILFSKQNSVNTSLNKLFEIFKYYDDFILNKNQTIIKLEPIIQEFFTILHSDIKTYVPIIKNEFNKLTTSHISNLTKRKLNLENTNIKSLKTLVNKLKQWSFVFKKVLFHLTFSYEYKSSSRGVHGLKQNDFVKTCFKLFQRSYFHLFKLSNNDELNFMTQLVLIGSNKFEFGKYYKTNINKNQSFGSVFEYIYLTLKESFEYSDNSNNLHFGHSIKYNLIQNISLFGIKSIYSNKLLYPKSLQFILNIVQDNKNLKNDNSNVFQVLESLNLGKPFIKWILHNDEHYNLNLSHLKPMYQEILALYLAISYEIVIKIILKLDKIKQNIIENTIDLEYKLLNIKTAIPYIKFTNYYIFKYDLLHSKLKYEKIINNKKTQQLFSVNNLKSNSNFINLNNFNRDRLTEYIIFIQNGTAKFTLIRNIFNQTRQTQNIFFKTNQYNQYNSFFYKISTPFGNIYLTIQSLNIFLKNFEYYVNYLNTPFIFSIRDTKQPVPTQVHSVDYKIKMQQLQSGIHVNERNTIGTWHPTNETFSELIAGSESSILHKRQTKRKLEL